MRSYKWGVLCLALGVVLMSGCQTSKAVAQGVGGFGSGAKLVAQGFQEDMHSAWEGIIKADDWVKTNLW